MNKIELEKAIEIKKAEIAAKEKEIDNFEVDVDEYEESYCDCMDSEGPVTVCGLTFDPSKIIRELDPIAYRCGLVDYVDSIDKTEDAGYIELTEELETLEDELSDLESELDDIDDEK